MDVQGGQARQHDYETVLFSCAPLHPFVDRGGAERLCELKTAALCMALYVIMMLALTVSDDNVIVLSLRNGTRALPY